MKVILSENHLSNTVVEINWVGDIAKYITNQAVQAMKKIRIFPISEFCYKYGLSWQSRSVYAQTAPSQRLDHSGFVQMVREKNPNVISIYCVIHHQTLAAKTVPNELKDVSESCFKIVNYVNKSASNTRLFTILCEIWEYKIKNYYFIQMYAASKNEIYIFDSLNLKLQVSDSTVIYHRDAITAYTDKLQLWKCKIVACNYSRFPKLFGILE
ncbi:SCAN domain-containing protein 3-like [Schistocerca piceifrons]|uniref:SCAN domain-containing protein 3-like n=1 Tax=Schistocerca piceifrons TaxID=274613 RepID=UPI001F5F8B11|nr:SCAN domain-containing protein 3-like [Schistocerca piceifrons]